MDLTSTLGFCLRLRRNLKRFIHTTNLLVESSRSSELSFILQSSWARVSVGSTGSPYRTAFFPQFRSGS
jgi:hypothetical protein